VLVISHGARLVAFGVAAGVSGALASTRLIASMLYQTPPDDPLVFAAVTTLLVAIAAAAGGTQAECRSVSCHE
jgi:hypothetical protein